MKPLKDWRQCPECRGFFDPAEPEQVYCSRHCARTAQARRGIPSEEDRVARFVDEVLKLHRDIFKK